MLQMTIPTFMPSHRETALSGLRARSVLRARKAPMLPKPAPSAPKLMREIWKIKQEAQSVLVQSQCISNTAEFTDRNNDEV